LLDFQKNIDEFSRKNIQVIAASVDDLEHARETVDKYRISFKVGYDLSAKEISSRTGAFYDSKDGYLHATGYIINPDARIASGVYSTLAIGCLVPKECLGLIDYFKGS